MAVGTNEKILLNYLHQIEYNNDALNAIGATASTTLRTLPTIAGTTYHVEKFGRQLSVTACTAISDLPVGQTMVVYALDGTELGRKTAAGAFTAGGTVAAQGVYIELSGAATVITSPETITLTGKGAHNVVMPAETLGAAGLRLYVSDTTSTYYDSAMMYGGARHAAAGTAALPDFDIATCYARCGATDGVSVDDSEAYDEDLTSSGQSLNTATTAIFAALGQTPKITSGVGARITREVAHDGNNTDTAYVSKTGNDADPGTYQEPYLTIDAAFIGTVIGPRTNVNIMDSETYIESITTNKNIVLEPLYGQMPKISGDFNIANMLTISFYGLTIESRTGAACIRLRDVAGAVIYSGIIRDNTVSLGIAGIQIQNYSTFNGIIQNNKCFNCTNGIELDPVKLGTGIITKNICFNNIHGIHLELTNNNSIGINNNLSYNNSNWGFYISRQGGIYSGVFENNTSYNNTDGIRFNFAAGWGGTIHNCITWNNTSYDLLKTGAAAITITESNYLTNSGFTIGAGNITTDPKFCKTTSPYKFGISADSGAYRTDTSSDDMGAHLRIIEINADDIVINGFYIDGQEQYNNAIYIADAVNHTGTNIKWCSIYDFQGIAIDLYDDNASTDAVILNCKIYQNGNGVKFAYGGNEIEQSLIYNNTIFGVWADYIAQEFTHNVFYGNYTGLYIESNSGTLIIRDNIFSGNSNKDIDSEILVAPTYCCIEGAVNSNVDITSDTNVLTDPLFVDVGNADFNLKVIEGGYLIDSQCKDVSSDSPVQDIGAWNMSHSIESEAWRKYQLAWNPRKLDPEYNPKGVTKFENALGFTKMFEKGHLRVLPMQWSRTQASTEALWKKIQYLSSLVPDRDQGRTADQCRIRVNPLPAQLIISGTAATISAATKTILDTDLDLTEDELKGYWASVKYLSGTGMTIDNALKTGTVAGTPWTVNAWTGWYLHLNGNYYLIKSNTANIVTLSDPNDTLVSEVTAWAFEKYFKMIKTENQILHLEDEDGELPTGSYDYYVDFIEMHVVKSGFKTIQERFYWLQEAWKTGFNLFLEEL